MAYLTFRILFNRWSFNGKPQVAQKVLAITSSVFSLIPSSKLKNGVNCLTQRLLNMMSSEVKPFYISQCICKLLTALARSDCKHQDLESQVEAITGMLFSLLSEEVQQSDAYSVENHRLTLKAFSTLTRLYSDQLVTLLPKATGSDDPGKMVLALQVFTTVFETVPQTKQLQREVINFTILVIQKDHKPVLKALLNFIAKLSKHKCLDLPEGNSVIDYVIKISKSDSLNEEGIGIM
ncbi:maestro heat-like repeat-containing protein family member 1 [Rhynchonycteris naso]